MKTRSNMPLFVVECDNVKTLSNSQIDLLRCGDYLVKKDASGEHAYKVTFKSDTGMCLTYHDASVIETQSYDKVNGNWVYNSEDKTELPVNEGDLVVNDLEVKGDAKLFENIVDKDGHKRFIEGEISLTSTEEKISKTYGKWSLSGTHLMFVLGGSIESGGVWTGANTTIVATVPKWIYDKLIPLFLSNLDIKNFTLYNSDYSTQTLGIIVQKVSENRVSFVPGTAFTASKDRIIRLEFDFLIDNE